MKINLKYLALCVLIPLSIIAAENPELEEMHKKTLFFKEERHRWYFNDREQARLNLRTIVQTSKDSDSFKAARHLLMFGGEEDAVTTFNYFNPVYQNTENQYYGDLMTLLKEENEIIRALQTKLADAG